MTFSGITYDSRRVKPGFIFVAIPGLKHDGADFVPRAIAAGAKLIVAEKAITVPSGVELKVVPSAREALADLSAEFYGHPSKKLKLIGITGTKGKTTTSYFIRSILNEAGFRTGLIGTVAFPMTTPEASDLQAELARLVNEGCSHCVLEVSSHALAQERVRGCHFAIAIFTNLSHDHLDYHRTMDGYLLAKRKLFEMLDRDAIAIINIDDQASSSLISVVKGEVYSFGLEQAKHDLRNTKFNDSDAVVAAVEIREKEMAVVINGVEVRTPLIGRHNAYNLTAAFQCGLVLGLRQSVIKAGIENVKVIPGRQEKIELGQPFTVIVDFAHSPDSLEKLLQTYRQVTQGKLILVFGCPGDRDRAKRPMMGEIAARLADIVFVTTDDPYSEEPESIISEIMKGIRETGDGRRVKKIVDRREAIKAALIQAKKLDTVLIAGRGHEKYQDFKGEKVQFDDKLVVIELIKGLF
ncbi:MAG: UDP-N-acetylmuramoyl-L-alanyl-D-glutamate--2,6-diaminopimelate ligase [Candidatus Margulisbacteria bacterium]|nr:UDP-N-acetylmuramoyl-L-alanyl-D-glutamate--2,6-diaminopimelate ligase [Candidatus Margulisiibacteriota bacterium]